MSRLAWDETGEHLYETGVDRGVVYPYDSDSKQYKNGEAWNGLTGWTESPSGADETKLYADNIKYLSLRAAEDFGATVTAYTYPDAVGILDGSVQPVKGIKIYQQARKAFGMCVRTIVGNDTEMNDYGYKLHLVYGMTMSPSEKSYSTVNDSPEAIEFSWELSSTPVAVKGYKPTGVLTIESKEVDSAKLAAFEDILYGSDATEDSYVVTSDTSFQPDKTYYEKSGENTYTETSDVTMDPTKTYYEKIPGHEATSPRLPLPDEVIEFFGATVGG